MPESPSSKGGEEPVVVVVIADDDADSLNIVRTRLETAGDYKVVTASNGQAALAAVRQYKPALVILDVMMPRLNGFQVTRMIKFDKQLRDTPVLLLTVRTEEVDRETGVQVGADEYLNKPLDPDLLMKQVNRYVQRWRSRRAKADADVSSEDPTPAA